MVHPSESDMNWLANAELKSVPKSTNDNRRAWALEIPLDLQGIEGRISRLLSLKKVPL